jgi:hypothetical protein
MIDNELYFKVMKADLPATMKKLGYAFFTNGFYNLNIIGIRKNNDNKITNKYDDILVVLFRNERGWQRAAYNISTEPGDYYMRKQLGNPKGTAILVPGQYRGCWEIGKHNGKYTALVQKKPVKVYRDGNKDDVYDMQPETINNGLFGINIHRSNQGFTRDTVDMYSAGCQVFNDYNDFNKFMATCEEQHKRYGNSFTYTLIDEKDLELD